MKEKNLYAKKAQQLKEEVIARLKSALAGRSVEFDNWGVVVTERHSGETWTEYLHSVSEDGFVSTNGEYTWPEMSLTDLCAVLDAVIDED